MDIPEFINVINERLKSVYALNKQMANNLFTQLKTIINPMGLRVSYNFDEETSTLRYIITINEAIVNYSIPLTRLARGLIIAIVQEGSTFTAKVLCVPTRETIETRDLETLNKESANYDIYPLLDGVNIHFYFDPYYGWRWGTHHSFDIKETSWRGYKYADLFKNIQKDFSFDALNKDYVYHIRMKHPSIHPYMPNTQFVYHLSTFSLTDMTFVNDCVGFKKQKKVQVDAKEQGMGYIFRAKDADRMDVKFETDRRREIVKMLYKVPNISNSVKRQEFTKYFAMKDFYILHNFMKPEFMHKKFFGIFKQFQELRDYYDKIINEVVALMGDSFPEINQEDVESTTVRTIAKKINKVLEPKIRVLYSNTGNKKTIKDLVMDQRNTFLIYNCIYSEKQDMSKSKLAEHIPSYTTAE